MIPAFRHLSYRKQARVETRGPKDPTLVILNCKFCYTRCFNAAVLVIL